jgi:hypothetical protein
MMKPANAWITGTLAALSVAGTAGAKTLAGSRPNIIWL